MVDARIQAWRELDALVRRGDEILETYWEDLQGVTSTGLPEDELRAFLVAGAATVIRIAGRDSEFYRHLPQPPPPNEKIALSRQLPSMVLGVLTALRDAVYQGLLGSFEQRIRANVHGDFLVQAKDLLDQSYHVPAMVLIGGVLEDHLQKLCIARSLQWKGDGSLGKYNDLLKETLYSQAEWRRIQSIGDDRNDAAHGQGQKVKPENVRDHLGYVQRLLTDYPS